MPGLDLTIPRMPYLRPGAIFVPEAAFSALPLPAGALWRGTLGASVHAAHTGDVDASFGGTLGEIEDQSGNARHLTQASASLRPTFGRRPRGGLRNLLLNTNAPASQSRSVAAVAHTLSFRGTGSVTRSGVSTGATVGTGATDRVSVTFTPTAGSLTLTLAGSVTEIQLETGSTASPYQAVGATAFDVTEAGVESVTYADFDLVDDALATGAIAGGLTGQAFVAGDGGCFVSDLSIAAAGTFTLGGTSHTWTGATPGLLRAVTGNSGRVLDAMIRAGTFAEAEVAALERFYRARGGKGLLVSTGPNLVTNGGFGTDLTGWTNTVPSRSTLTWVSGEMRMDATSGDGGLPVATQTFAPLTIGQPYLFRWDARTTDGATTTGVILGSYTNAGGFSVAAGRAVVVVPTSATGGVNLYGSIGKTVFFDNVSLHRLIPREEL